MRVNKFLLHAFKVHKVQFFWKTTLLLNEIHEEERRPMKCQVQMVLERAAMVDRDMWSSLGVESRREGLCV